MRKIGVLLVLVCGVGTLFAGVKADIKRATEFEQIGDFESAVVLFEALYKNDPLSSASIEGLQRNYARLGLHTQLIQLYDQILARHPNNTHAAFKLADLLLSQEPHNVKAGSLLTAVLTKNRDEPNSARVARIYVKHRRWKQALEIYRTYRKKSDNPLLFIEEVAQVYQKLGEYAKMADEYMKLTGELNKEKYTYITGMFERLGDDKKAYKALIHALATTIQLQEKKKRYLLYKLVQDLHMLNDNIEAAFTTVKAMDADAGRKGTDVYEFAEWCRTEGLHQEALMVDAYLIAHIPSPFVPHAYYNSALSEIELGNFERGRAFLDTVTHFKRHKLAVQARYSLGELSFKHLHQPAKALTYYTYIIKHSPRGGYVVDAQFRIGECRVAVGSLSKAERIFADLEIKTRGNTEQVNRARFARAEVLFLQHKFDAARDILTQLVAQKETLYRNDALTFLILLKEEPSMLKPYANALFLERQFRGAQACDAWQALLIQTPRGALAPHMYLNLAAAYGADNKWHEAAEVYRTFLKELPTSPYAARVASKLGILLQDALHNTVGAVEVYTHFLQEFPLSPLVAQVRHRLRQLL